MYRLLVLAGVAVGAGLAADSLAGEEPKSLPLKLATHKVAREKLPLEIVERGTVESAMNFDIYCRVKAGNKGGTVATTIKWLIDEGATVKKGDLLLGLDDSGLQQQLREQNLFLVRAEADRIKAEENSKIQKSQNESDVKTATVNVQLAKIDLQKYLESDLEQFRKETKARALLAEADLVQAEDAVEQTERLLKLGTATEGQARAARLRFEAAKLTLEKTRLESQAIEKFAKPRTETELLSRMEKAQTALERVRQQAQAKESQAQSAAAAAKSIYEQARAVCQEIEEQIRLCKIFAPQAGMVIYYIPEQARFGGGQQSIVAQGEPVREGQKLMQIADLTKIVVNVKVHETLVSRVKAGQKATIRVESFGGSNLHGQVDSVAMMAAQTDFMSADVKVYVTKVKIDPKDLEGVNLRPGMTGAVTVDLDHKLENVLVVPSRALIGRGGFGKSLACLVLTADGPEEREVVVGARNAKVAEIVSGLREGDEVIVNPQLLLNDIRDRIRFLPSGRPGARP